MISLSIPFWEIGVLLIGISVILLAVSVYRISKNIVTLTKDAEDLVETSNRIAKTNEANIEAITNYGNSISKDIAEASATANEIAEDVKKIKAVFYDPWSKYMDQLKNLFDTIEKMTSRLSKVAEKM
jgi:phage-related protein